VHVDIVEPHMYSEDDAVAKVDGYLIEVTDGIDYVGQKVLVRIEQAGRTTARAVLAEVAEEAAAASEERRKARERAAKRAPRKPRRRETEEVAAVEALAEDDAAVHAGTGPAAVAEADEDTARPRGRRRSRAKPPIEGTASESPATASDSPGEDAFREAEGGAEVRDDAVQSKPRRRGRRGGRRRSRANAEVSSDASD
jgi:ribonuclease G